MNDIDRLHNVILVIAQEINRICKKYDISYSLDGGTMLGAVRHKGFIPWDDDFDIGMKREDYEKFISVCKTELDEQVFFLQTENVYDYAFSFSKIHINGTEIIENFSKNANVHHGIFIDIFPYDNLPDNNLTRKIFLLKNHLLKNLIWVKCKYGSKNQKNRLSYRVTKTISCFFSLEGLKKSRSRHLKKYNKISTKYCFTSDYPKYLLENKWFENIIDYSFEDHVFSGFKNANEFLTMEYQDYMELPPINERTVHSKYKINFGPYE